MAIGYDYKVDASSPKIAAVEPPILGDNTYRLHLFDGSPDQIIQGGQVHVLPEGGVDHFQLLDIKESAGLDPENPLAFITGLESADAGLVHLTMTPLVENGTNNDPLHATIGIKPGTDLAPINTTSNGVVAVALLATSEFDLAAVDHTTVRFGKNGTEARSTAPSLEDVNGDGKLDLVYHFRTRETGVVCGDTTAKLTGKTTSGRDLIGSGAVKTVSCK